MKEFHEGQPLPQQGQEHKQNPPLENRVLPRTPEEAEFLKQREEHEATIDEQTLQREREFAWYYWVSAAFERYKAEDLSEEDFKRMLSKVIVQKELETETQYELARRDKLTELPNRLALEEELQKAVSAGEHFGLINLDLDKFKDVNDTLGHAAGDTLLMRVAQELQSSVRQLELHVPGGVYKPRSNQTEEEDIAARPGGEEFIIIMKGVNNDKDLQSIAERIRTTIEQAQINVMGIDNAPTPLRITASVGATLFNPNNPVSTEEIQTRADLAMYNSKYQAGIPGGQRVGNRTTLYKPGMTMPETPKDR